ncbi:hypothetical protein PRIPAC_72759 [Pristionchus pacificus]|uniref:Uncharacterized protein n=1 Tax=Pristionchus pacificus TaxID=54126 RepID=A0A454XYY5_PRIPA|nr:hypothetical protein PRIPAC_72759 [Pristionchus pacificus]|eukprot:PDM71692.1 hypothetical protein PRIPAC_38099 [Pristionchus pacificus]
MRASLALLLVSLDLACAAPLKVDHEAAAKKFMGELLNVVKTENHTAILSFLSDKAESYFPGMVTGEAARELKVAVAEYVAADEEKEFELPPSVLAQLKGQLFNKMKQLNNDAKLFVQEIAANKPELPTKYRAFAGDVRAFRLKFEALSSSARSSLIEQFPFFGKLEEIEAMVQILDNIMGHIKGICANVPGFSECDKLAQYFE